ATFDKSLGLQLLAVINAMFGTEDRITSKALLATLHADETGPWLTYGKSQKPITENAVAKLLAPYGPKPKPIKLKNGDVKRGDPGTDFEDVLRLHPLPDKETEDETVPPPFDSDFNPVAAKQTVTGDFEVTDEIPFNPIEAKEKSEVTAEKE